MRKLILIGALLAASAGVYAVKKQPLCSTHNSNEVLMKQLPNNWVLYIGQGCPYCKKVTDFVAQHNLTLKTINVWDDQAAADQLFSWTQRRTVPYLRMGDTGMHESADIVERIKEEAALGQ